jgi:hypothetical protein
MTMMFCYNNFEFFDLGIRHRGSYEIADSIDNEVFELTQSGDARDRTLSYTLNLALQYPAFDLFNRSNSSIIDMSYHGPTDWTFNLESNQEDKISTTVSKNDEETTPIIAFVEDPTPKPRNIKDEIQMQ